MTDPRQVIEALLGVETGIQRIVPRIEGSFQQAGQEIRRVSDALERGRIELERELAQAEHDLFACESSRDEDGGGYDCSEYARRVGALKNRLEELLRVSIAFEQAEMQYQARHDQIRDVLSREMPGACFWLRERELALTRFESVSRLPSLSAAARQGAAGATTGATSVRTGSATAPASVAEQTLYRRVEQLQVETSAREAAEAAKLKATKPGDAAMPATTASPATPPGQSAGHPETSGVEREPRRESVEGGSGNPERG
jgi:hypothetical protein